MRSKYFIGAVMGLCMSHAAIAQSKLVDRRDQAEGWYVPIHGQVMVNGKKASDVEIILYRDNIEIGRLNGKKKGQFQLDLDIDQAYSVRLIKKGFQEKLIYVDTSIPNELVSYPDYLCYIDLSPKYTEHMDPFYTDFPSAIIRFDEAQGGFYHSEQYLSHIQTRSGIARVTK